jgi:hypothetical protein
MSLVDNDDEDPEELRERVRRVIEEDRDLYDALDS